MKRSLLVAVLACATFSLTRVAAQKPAAPSALPHPRGYVALRAAQSPVIDGRLDDAAWQTAAWTDAFVDIEGDAKPKPALRTRAKMAWDAQYLYLAAQLEEPNVWGTITEHDAVIFRDHDFEVFIDPDGDSHHYFEFEINARGAYWDLLLPRPYRAGGQAVDSWDIRGLKSAVFIDGTLNQPGDVDRGWSVELAFPWSAYGPDERQATAPRDGDQWRINFSRVEWTLDVADGGYVKRAGVPEFNWVWSPQHVVDMHRPERWGYVQFASSPATFVPDVSWPARQWLQRVYEAQREYFATNHRYASTLEALRIAAPADATLVSPKLFVTPSLFEATVELRGNGRAAEVWHIRQDARVWHEAKIGIE